MLQSAKELSRFRVRATDGKVGKAADFYFEDGGWAIRYLVVNTGGWMVAQRVLVPPEKLGLPDSTSRSLPVSLTKQEILCLVAGATEQPVSYQAEQLVATAFGSKVHRRGGGPMASVHGTMSSRAMEMAEARVQDDTPVEGRGPALRSTQEVIGYQIEAVDGPLGVAEDFLLDDDDWVIRYILVNTKSWKPGRQVLLPPSWVQEIIWSESRIHVNVHRNKLKASARFEPGSHDHVRPPKPLLWP